jgi:enoyl-CoA hydratase
VLEIVRTDAVQTWTMRFGEANAISPAFLDAFDAALGDALADDAVAAVVLTSGLRVFSAGADAGWMRELVDERGLEGLLDEFHQTMNRFRDLCIRMRRSDVLFVAALNGHTLAGGLELAAACDLRFCSDHDRIQIGAPEMKLFGVMPSGGGGAQFIARLMGPARALNFILEGASCTPREAYALGLVERLYAPDDLLGETTTFAGRVAATAGRVGINAAKRSILTATHLPLYEALEVDSLAHWDSMRRGGFLPGVQAFVERFG